MQHVDVSYEAQKAGMKVRALMVPFGGLEPAHHEEDKGRELSEDPPEYSASVSHGIVSGPEYPDSRRVPVRALSAELDLPPEEYFVPVNQKRGTIGQVDP